MKFGKANDGPSEVNKDMIVSSDQIGMGVRVKLFLRVLDGKGIPDEGIQDKCGGLDL